MTAFQTERVTNQPRCHPKHPRGAQGLLLHHRFHDVVYHLLKMSFMTFQSARRCAPPAAGARTAGIELHLRGRQARQQGRLPQADCRVWADTHRPHPESARRRASRRMAAATAGPHGSPGDAQRRPETARSLSSGRALRTRWRLLTMRVEVLQIQHDGIIRFSRTCVLFIRNIPCLVGKSVAILRPARASKRGRIAIVTERWRGLQWTPWRQVFLHRPNVHGGRRSRVVLAPRPWRQAAGKSRRRRWQERPLHRGEHEISRNPLRGESRDDWLNLW